MWHKPGVKSRLGTPYTRTSSMQTLLANIGFLVNISETCLVLLMNYCVSNELRVLKKNRYMKNLHKKVIIDDTGFRWDSVSV